MGVTCCLIDVPYEMTVYTGDVKSAGTDSAISMTMFGTEGTTPEFVLDKDESRFERACVDLIRMDLDDVGKLLKVRIAVDGKGTRPDWFLEKVRHIIDCVLNFFFFSFFFTKDEKGRCIEQVLLAIVFEFTINSKSSVNSCYAC